MDPFAIARAVQDLYTTSKTIYNFIQETNNVDASLQNLQRQVDGLAKVLDALAQALQHQVVKDHGDDKRQLWNSVAESLEACYPTVRQLDEKLGGVRGNEQRRNFVYQAYKTYKLGLTQAEIDKLLSEMQTHSVNLQLALGIVQLMIAASTPETVAHELSSRFERLERMMMTIDERLASSTYPQLMSTIAQNKVTSVQVNDNTRSLRESASSVITSASTATGRSVSGMTQRAMVDSREPAFEHFDPPELDQSFVLEESTTGSELGKPIESARRTQIQSWIQASTVNLTDVPEVPEGAASTATRSETLTSIFSGMSIVSDAQDGEATLEIFDESSDDDGLDLQVVKSYFSRAESKMETEDFIAAEEFLRRGLDESQHLNLKKRQELNLDDAQLSYAKCCFMCEKIEEAEEVFSALTREPVKDVKGAVRTLRALHGLAIVSLRKRKYEAAAAHCRQALQGRRRTKTIGKHHADYFASLRLLALITWARNDRVQAEAFSDLLPKEMQLDPQSFGRVLEVEYRIGPMDIVSPSADGSMLLPASQSSHDLRRASSRNSVVGRDRSPIPSQQPLPSQVVSEGHDTARQDPPTRAQSESSVVGKAKTAGPPHAVRQSSEVLGTIPQSRPTPPLPPPGYSHQGASSLVHVATSPAISVVTRRSLLDRPASLTSPPQSPMSARKDPSEALLRAVQANDVGLAGILIQGFGQKTKVDVNVRGLANQTPLIIAASNRNVAMCQLLISSRASINDQDDYGLTALALAADHGAFRICELLLEQRADPSLAGARGVTPLMCASHGSHLTVCKLLLDSGANLRAKADNGNDALGVASDPKVRTLLSKHLSGSDQDTPRASANSEVDLGLVVSAPKIQIEPGERDLPIVSEDERLEAQAQLRVNGFLFSNGRIDSHGALFWAIENSYYAAVDLLLNDYSVELTKQRKSEDDQETALHRAAWKGQWEICKRLLDAGAPMNALDEDDRTPLDKAAGCGQTEVAKLLLERGAWINGTGIASTPLTLASSHNFLDTCELLISKGADVNGRNNKGDTALIIAVEQSNTKLFDMMFDAGADTSAISHDDHTCLIRAIAMKNSILLAHIISKGCNVNGGNSSGTTALHYAVSVLNQTMCGELLGHGADPNVQDNAGRTPLMYLCSHDMVASKPNSSTLAVVTKLLESGADPNIADKSGDTPLIVTSKNGLASFVSVLISNGAETSLKNSKGETALSCAAAGGHLSTCQKLVMWGAEVLATDNKGKTSIDRAKTKEVKKFLKSKQSV